MKIAYLFSRYPVPSQTFCDTEIRALEEAGHEIEIYSCSPPTTSFRHGGPADWPRARVFYAPPGPVLEAWADAARRDGNWPAEMVADHETRFGPRYEPARRATHALYFAARLRRRGIEHLHVHFANRATHAALFIHAMTDVPFSLTAHAQDFLVDLGNDDLLRRMCERAAFVVAVSDWSRRALVERCPAAAQKIHRIYNGLPLERWPLPRAISEPTESGLQIFSVGRLIDFKGFDDLIAACHLLQERGIQFSCEIAGDGPLRVALEQQAARFDDPRYRVFLSGLLSQEEIRARLNDCDVFALACRTAENGACDVLPTVILEAMAAAKPVVSTRLAAVPEIVEDGVTGFLSRPNDAADFTDSFVRLAGDAALRLRLGEAGRSRLAARFSAAEASRHLQTLFAQAGGIGRRADQNQVASADGRSLFCLCDTWPPPGFTDGSTPTPAEIVACLGRRPGTCLTALKPGSYSSASDTSTDLPTMEVLRAIEFMPDEFVLETHWRNAGTLAYRLEAWRAEIGGACGTDTFLLAARRAVYLDRRAPSNSPRWQHLHSVGPQSLLCAWLLRRLGAAHTISFLLPPRPEGGAGLPGSTLRKLAPEFVGGWVVGERKLAASFGPNFHGGKLDAQSWMTGLEQWLDSASR